jgi:hypothetical protein
VIIIEQEQGEKPGELPDGLDDLSKHNLMTYKSHRQPLDAWTIDELLGHYVNYRKQMSPSSDRLLAVEDFRFYAVSTRQPEKLQREVAVRSVQAGVHEVQWGTHTIRIIVLSQMPRTPNNAIWQVFSGIPDNVEYGVSQYHWRIPDHSTLMNQLYQMYYVEEMNMPYTFEDFYRDFTRGHLNDLTPEERLEGLSSEERLKGLSPEEILKSFSPEELEIYLSNLQRQKQDI